MTYHELAVVILIGVFGLAIYALAYEQGYRDGVRDETRMTGLRQRFSRIEWDWPIRK